MAKIIVAEIMGDDNEVVGYRVCDMENDEFSDLNVEEALNLMSGDDLTKLLGGIDGLGGLIQGITNAEIKDGKIQVDGFDKRPVQINKDNELLSKASHSLCGFSPNAGKIAIADYTGCISRLSLRETKELMDRIGIDKISNSKLLETVEKAMAKEEADKPKSVFIGDNEALSTPKAWQHNELVCSIYNAASNPESIIGAYILNRKMKFDKGVLRSDMFDQDGKMLAEKDKVVFGIDNQIVNTFVLLETTGKRFITVPVCEAFKQLIEAFEIKDITVEKFHDFIDFLTEEIEELDLETEKIVSKLLGANIKEVYVDNTENVTVYVEDGQPQVDYEVMDATFNVVIGERKKTEDIELISFPWVIM